ncbi:hypothetical protein [Streptomyces sp. NPDC093598]|uniref:hypothetical protein n=1 Tax=Streptomyces sp. NPDC093598 TaxID=3366046 RepID=UPI003826F583
MLFLLIGGAVADRLPRHRTMVSADVLNLRRRTTPMARGGTGRASADAERPVGGLG